MHASSQVVLRRPTSATTLPDGHTSRPDEQTGDTGGATGAAALADTKIPEKTVKSQCKAAGGTYSTSVLDSGNRNSSCVYKDISGTTHHDTYSNGHYDDLD